MRGGLAALGDVAPGGIHWPTDAEYVAELSRALDAIEPVLTVPVEQGGVFSPPLQSQASGLVATLEGASGLSVKQLVSLAHSAVALSQATSPPEIVAAVGDLMNGTLAVATDLMKAAGAATDALDAASWAGQAINSVFVLAQLVADSQARYAEYAALCQRRIDEQKNVQCEALADAADPTPTGPVGQLRPADLFRPVGYALQRGRPLPLSVASMFVMLCGGETQGFGPLSRPAWQQLVADYRNSSGKTNVGIAAASQRRMWSLIKGILAAMRPPGASPGSGDGGRALMPLLLDIVGNEWFYGTAKPQASHGIDRGFCELLSRRIGGQYYDYIECPDLSAGEIGAGALPAGAASCAERVNLEPTFEQLVVSYRNALVAEFWDEPTQRWKRPPKKMVIGRAPTGLLTIKGVAASNLAANMEAIETGRPRFGAGAKALLGLGAAGGGYGIYTLIKVLRRRGRP